MELPLITLSGSPRRMGESFGEACRDDIHAMCDARLEAARNFARSTGGREVSLEDVLRFAQRCLPIAAAWDPTGHEEWLGIARGASIAPPILYAAQGLTDLRDLLAFADLTAGEGCSAFIVARDRAARGRLLLGQTWDLHTSNMRFVTMVHRRPSDGPHTWSLTLTGCLTLIGLSELGIAVATTNLTSIDARPGVHYLSLLHRALRSSDLDEAVRVVTTAPRLGAHLYLLAGPRGRAAAVECTATRSHVTHVDQGVFVQCNHALQPRIAELEAPIGNDSTCARRQRLDDLIRSHPGPVDIADLRTMLGDHEGGPNALCRHDLPPHGISTNACVILSPDTFGLHACRAQAHVGQWVTHRADQRIMKPQMSADARR